MSLLTINYSILEISTAQYSPHSRLPSTMAPRKRKVGRLVRWKSYNSDFARPSIRRAIPGRFKIYTYVG